MQSSVLQGILLPFWGTSLGAACVFCLRRAPSAVLRRVLEGFAAGVMTAASVWSLLLPAIDWADMGRWSFLPAAALIVPALPWLLGFAAGAMLYVVAAELLPTRGDPGPGALAFAAGFTVMMILDVALG